MPESKGIFGLRKLSIMAALMATFVAAGCGATNRMPGAASTVGTSSVSDGTLSSAALSASSQNISFGDVLVGTATAQLVSLTNTGAANLNISSVTISGRGYTVSGGSNVILTPSQTVTISVNFQPSAAGSSNGSLSITSDATDPVLKMSISGNGVTHEPNLRDVQLSWTSASSEATGYFVYRSNISGGPYRKLNTVEDTLPTFTDPELPSGNYYYVVTSVDAKGNESSYSSEVTVTVP